MRKTTLTAAALLTMLAALASAAAVLSAADLPAGRAAAAPGETASTSGAASSAEPGPAGDSLLDRVPQIGDIIVVVKDYAAADEHLDAFLNQLIPHPAGQAPHYLRQGLAQLLAKPDFKIEGAVVAALDLARFIETGVLSDVVLMFEGLDFKALVGDAEPDEDHIYEFRLDGRPASAARYHGLTLVCREPETLAKFLDAPAGLKLASRQRALLQSSDLLLVVGGRDGLAPLLRLQQDLDRRKLERMREAIDDPDDPRLEMMERDMKEAARAAQEDQVFYRQWQYAVTGITIGAEGCDLQWTMSARADSTLASYLARQPALGPQLKPGPLAGDCAMQLWYSVEPDLVARLCNRLIDPLAKALDSAFDDMEGSAADRLSAKKLGTDMVARLREGLVPWGSQGYLFWPQPTGSGFQHITAAKVGNVVLTRQKLSQSCKADVELFKMMADRNRKGGAEAPFTLEAQYLSDVRKINGLPIDRFRISMIAPQESLDKKGWSTRCRALVGGDAITFWYALAGNYLLREAGPGPDHMAALMTALQVGNSSGGAGSAAEQAAGRELAARITRYRLPDANLAGTVNLPVLVEVGLATLWASSDRPMLLPPKSGGPGSVASLAIGDGGLSLRLVVPMSEVRQLRQSVTAAAKARWSYRAPEKRPEPPRDFNDAG